MQEIFVVVFVICGLESGLESVVRVEDNEGKHLCNEGSKEEDEAYIQLVIKCLVKDLLQYFIEGEVDETTCN